MSGSLSTAASTSSWKQGGKGTARQTGVLASISSRTRTEQSPDPWMIGNARIRGLIARKSSAGVAGVVMRGSVGQEKSRMKLAA